jgi:hypothetical protein
MGLKENKELARRWFEPQTPPEMADFGKVKDPKALVEKLVRAATVAVFAPDAVIHVQGKTLNREDLIKLNMHAILAAPDAAYKLDTLIAEGDMVAGVSRISVPGQNKETTYIITARIAGGKFVEEWSVSEVLP